MPKSTKILSSKEEIKEYIGNISDYEFEKYRKAGMPMRYEKGGGYIAHADNIDEFFRLYTRVSIRNNVQFSDEDSNEQ